METFEVTGKIPAVPVNSPSDSSGHHAQSGSKPDMSPGEFTLNDLEAFTGEMLDKPPMRSERSDYNCTAQIDPKNRHVPGQLY
jgi:hypothetical protein